MAETLFRAWWARFRGLLTPKPCPYSVAWILDLPMRGWLADPSRILDDFGLKPGDRVLEIGPGTGYYSGEASRRIGPAGRLIGVDIQLQMLQKLGGRLRRAGLESCDLIQADAAWLPLQSSSVDHVFMVTVLGEIPDRPRALEEIRRVLRPEGKLSISEQFPDPDFVRLRTLRRELPPLGFVEEASGGRLISNSTWRLANPNAR